METQFMRAYDQYADFLFRFGLQKTGDREKTKDIVQDAFMRMWQYLSADKVILNEKAFLFRTVRNLIIDHYRKHKSDSLENLQETGFNPPSRDHEILMAESEAQEVLRMLHRLEDEYQEVIFLRYVEGLQPRDIAEVVGESVNVVSVRLNRGMKKLQQLFHLL